MQFLEKNWLLILYKQAKCVFTCVASLRLKGFFLSLSGLQALDALAGECMGERSDIRVSARVHEHTHTTAAFVARCEGIWYAVRTGTRV